MENSVQEEFFVRALVDKNAFYFETIVDTSFYLFHAELSAFNVLEFDENTANFSTKTFLATTDDSKMTKLADVLHFSFKIVSQLFVFVN